LWKLEVELVRRSGFYLKGWHGACCLEGMPTPNVRMHDIARAVGVSPATVSRALRDDPRITAQLRQDIKDAALKLGYVPNPMVQALMTQRRTRQEPQWEKIALITNDLHDAWQGKDVCRWYLEGIRNRAEQRGCQVEVFSVEAYHDDPESLCRVLRARGIRGMILGFSRDAEHPVWLDVSSFSVVGLGTYFSGIPVDRVHLNGFYNVKMAIRQLRSLNYQRPALVAPLRNNAVVGGQWSAAALDEQWQRPEAQRCPPFMVEGTQANMLAFREWFELHRPDAIVAYKVNVIALLDRIRIRVPEDVGVAHLFGTELEKKTMAGVDGNLREVGAAAVDLLLQKLQINERGIPDRPRDVMIAGSWQDGPTVRRLEEAPPRKTKRPLPVSAV